MTKKILTITCLALCISLLAEAPKQLMNLPVAKRPRFALKDISWPQKYGQPEVCLWKNDKYAALSITVDDNCKPDHKWWLKQCKEFGFPITWFVITNKVGGKNKSFSGTWNDFAKLVAAGHSVQSHSASHGRTNDKLGNKELRKEYEGSKNAIETNIPGNKCLAIAYPWGKGKPKFAKKFFIAARGTVGTPNQANRINYMNTSGGHFKIYMIDSVLGNPIEKPKWLARSYYKRGWLTLLHHFVASGRTPEQKKASISKVRAFLEYANKNKAKLWIDTFVNVAKYGQERDSAKIENLKASPDKISFNITDDMKDDIFDMPLTVKIRLDKGWNKLNATQGNKPIDFLIIKHEGSTYALIQIVPDKGDIVLSN